MTPVVAADETGRLLARELAGILPTGDGACVVGACGREEPDAFASTAAECDEAGIAFFVVELGSATLRLSPVYGSVYGSCYHCRAEALRAVRGPFGQAGPVPAGWLAQHMGFALLAVADMVARLPH